MERRDLLKAGLYGFSGLSLGDLLRQRAFAIDHAAKPGDAIRYSKTVSYTHLTLPTKA